MGNLTVEVKITRGKEAGKTYQLTLAKETTNYKVFNAGKNNPDLPDFLKLHIRTERLKSKDSPE